MGYVQTVEPQAADAELVTALVDGDRTALAELYARHAPWLVLRLSRRCADPGVVDEVVQDTFVAVWRGARRWDGRGEVAAWIWGIGIRRLLDALRHRPAASTLLREPSEHEVHLVESAEERGCSASSTATWAPRLIVSPPSCGRWSKPPSSTA